MWGTGLEAGDPPRLTCTHSSFTSSPQPHYPHPPSPSQTHVHVVLEEGVSPAVRGAHRPGWENQVGSLLWACACQALGTSRGLGDCAGQMLAGRSGYSYSCSPGPRTLSPGAADGPPTKLSRAGVYNGGLFLGNQEYSKRKKPGRKKCLRIWFCFPRLTHCKH